MRNYLDGGEALLEAFRRLGVDYIVSSPGTEWAPVWEAMARQDKDGLDGPALIDCWHETVAVNIATGYTLATGRMQAVILHAASGLLQGSIGLQGALIAGVPMLVMSAESLTYGEQPDFDPGAQWIDNLSFVGGTQRILEPLTKFSTQVTSPHTLFDQVVRAGELAQRRPAAPVFLNVPFETMLHEWTPPARPRRVPPAPLLRAMPDDVDDLARRLVAAENPLVVTEAAGRDTAAVDALVELCELLAVPVVEAPNALFVNFPRDHPLHLGLNAKAARDAADLVLVVRARVPWYPAKAAPDAAIAVIDEVPHRAFMVHQNLHADHYLEGDVAATLRDLAAAARGLGIDADAVAARRDRHAAAHDALVERRRALRETSRQRDVIDAVALCAALADAMPDDTVYVEEVTTHTPLLREHLPGTRPGTLFTRQGGLGQGLGLTLGVKLAHPDRPVVALEGDGGLLYNPVLQALGASRDYDLPILIVIFDNGHYASMKSSHLRVYPDGVAATADRYYGVDLNAPDFVKIAESFGFHGERVADPARLAPAIEAARDAVAGGRTAILDVALG